MDQLTPRTQIIAMYQRKGPGQGWLTVFYSESNEHPTPSNRLKSGKGSQAGSVENNELASLLQAAKVCRQKRTHCGNWRRWFAIGNTRIEDLLYPQSFLPIGPKKPTELLGALASRYWPRRAGKKMSKGGYLNRQQDFEAGSKHGSPIQVGTRGFVENLNQALKK